jgi:hypothetical protein
MRIQIRDYFDPGSYKNANTRHIHLSDGKNARAKHCLMFWIQFEAFSDLYEGFVRLSQLVVQAGQLVVTTGII